MGNSDSIEPYTGNDDEFIQVTIVARKWKKNVYHLIDWSAKNYFDLYYPFPSPLAISDLTRKWLRIGRLVYYFLDGRTDITVPLSILRERALPFGTSSSSLQYEPDYLPANPDDYRLSHAHLPGCPPDIKVPIDFRDLHLHCSEIAAMEKKYPGLSGEVSEATTDSATVPEETNTTTPEPSKIKKESASYAYYAAVGSLFDKADSESVTSSSYVVNVTATGEKQLPPPLKMDNKSNSVAQDEKPKSTRQPKKLKQKTELPLNGGSVEPQISKEDHGVPIYLQLDEIVNKPNKGPKGMLRMGRSKWLAGVKSGKFPPPYDWGDRTNRWKLSDINLIIELMEKGETWADHIARTEKT